MDEAMIGSLIASTLRVSTPLIFCALAGLLSERSGVIDIGLEGKMLFAAFAAGAAGVAFGSTAIALLIAMGVTVLLSWLHGFACVSHRGDQVVSGVAINIIAVGMTQGIPVLGQVIGQGLLSHNALVYVALLLVPAVWWLMFRTRFGLRLRAVGENAHMVDAAGVSVSRMRYAALTLNGLLCGLAGSYLVLAQNAAFVPNMTAGRGFMALAALIFGKWHPVKAFWACLLFGFLDAVAIRLQGVPLPIIGLVPVQLIQALPYLLTVVLLAGFIGRTVAPQALGRPYLKER